LPKRVRGVSNFLAGGLDLQFICGRRGRCAQIHATVWRSRRLLAATAWAFGRLRGGVRTPGPKAEARPVCGRIAAYTGCGRGSEISQGPIRSPGFRGATGSRGSSRLAHLDPGGTFGLVKLGVTAARKHANGQFDRMGETKTGGVLTRLFKRGGHFLAHAATVWMGIAGPRTQADYEVLQKG